MKAHNIVFLNAFVFVCVRVCVFVFLEIAFPKQPFWWTEDQAWFHEWNGGTLVRNVSQIANGILRWCVIAFFLFYFCFIFVSFCFFLSVRRM